MQFYCGEVRKHQGKGLINTQLALAQAGHRLWIEGIAGQMKTTQAFDSQDFTFHASIRIASGEPDSPVLCTDGG